MRETAIPTFMNSVNNAYDFAATTVQLYGNTPQDQNVLDLGEILFGEAAVSTAISESGFFFIDETRSVFHTC